MSRARHHDFSLKMEKMCLIWRYSQNPRAGTQYTNPFHSGQHPSSAMVMVYSDLNDYQTLQDLTYGLSIGSAATYFYTRFKENHLNK